MSELKQFDDNIIDDQDQYETPRELFDHLRYKYDIFPLLDVAANVNNSKTQFHLHDALHQEWVLGKEIVDVWCNPPHSKTEEFVLRAENQWLKYGMNILMIVPANSICASYFDSIFRLNHARYYRISGRPQFLRDGRPSKFPSRNSYFAVVWRKR